MQVSHLTAHVADVIQLLETESSTYPDSHEQSPVYFLLACKAQAVQFSAEFIQAKHL